MPGIILESSSTILICLIHFFLSNLGDFHYFLLQCADSFHCIIWSTVDSFQCTFHFSYCIFQALFGSSLYFLAVKLHCVLQFFSWVCWAFLWSLPMSLCQADCLAPLHFVLLLRFCLVPDFGTYFSISSFCLNFSFISKDEVGWLHFLFLEKWAYAGDIQ